MDGEQKEMLRETLDKLDMSSEVRGAEKKRTQDRKGEVLDGHYFFRKIA